MVPARKTTDEQTEDFVANDGRVTILHESICYMHLLTTRSSICLMFFNLCVDAEPSVTLTNSSALSPLQTTTAPPAPVLTPSWPSNCISRFYGSFK